jgi:hypothetical protein
MEPTVWHSRMMKDPNLGIKQGLAAKWFGGDWDPPTDISPTSSEQLESLMRYARGEPLPREAFPEALYVFDRRGFNKIGELFTAGSYYAVGVRLGASWLKCCPNVI